MTRIGLPVALLLIATAPALAADTPASTRVVGYLPARAVRSTLDRIDADRLTHINYAFAAIDQGGRLVAGDRAGLAALRAFKAKHPRIRTLASVGGWGASGRFSDAALTDDSRRAFARSCVAFLDDHGLDGIDIDWEYPVLGGKPGDGKRPEDRENYTKLLAAIRAAIDAKGKAEGHAYLLTIAAPATGRARDSIDLKAVAPILDWINVMTYDFAGGWSKVAGFNAPLFDPEIAGMPKGDDVDASIRGYLKAGVAPEKIVVGVAFYGRGWVVSSADRDGLGGKPAAEHPRDLPPGFAVRYRDVAAKFPDSARRWDDHAKAPYRFDPARKIFFGYDDAESLRLKADYARDRKLGGLMIWELSGDDDRGTLLRALTSP